MADDSGERVGHAGHVDPDLALIDDRRLVGVHDFDGIVDRDDVVPFAGVDVIDEGGDGRRPAGSGQAGHEHEPGVGFHERREHRWEAEGVDAGHTRHDAAEHEADVTALMERADPEPAESLDRVDELGVAGLAEGVGLGRGDDAGRDVVGVAGFDGVKRGFDERSVDAYPGPGPDLEVQVGRPLLDRGAEELVQVEHGYGYRRRDPFSELPAGLRPGLGPSVLGGGDDVAAGTASGRRLLGVGRFAEQDGEGRRDRGPHRFEVVPLSLIHI